jgi:hypothetical protein
MPPPSPYGIRLSFAQNGSSLSSGASFPLAVVHWRDQAIYEKSTTAHRRKKDTLFHLLSFAQAGGMQEKKAQECYKRILDPTPSYKGTLSGYFVMRSLGCL